MEISTKVVVTIVRNYSVVSRVYRYLLRRGEYKGYMITRCEIKSPFSTNFHVLTIEASKYKSLEK